MIIAILCGSLTGYTIYNKYDNTTLTFNESNKVYVLQEGIYETKDSLDRNTRDINPKLVIKKNNKYHVYLGISKSLDGINKIKKIYSKKGYSTLQSELTVKNESFIMNLSQYDILLDSSKNEEDILTIEEVVLSNYEEITKS